MDENSKFDEVANDIIELISRISYEDVEKQKLLVQILLNFNKMCESYSDYLHMMSVLQKEEVKKEHSRKRLLKK